MIKEVTVYDRAGEKVALYSVEVVDGASTEEVEATALAMANFDTGLRHLTARVVG